MGARGTRRWQLWALLGLLALVATLAYQVVNPPDRPIAYRIGEVDPRFGVERAAFADAVEKAAGLWSAAAGRALFREDPQGALEVRLVFDHRQALTERLTASGLRLDGSRASYEALRARHAERAAELARSREALRADLEAYNQRVAAFNAAGEQAQRGGLASDAERRRLAQEHADLASLKATLEAQQGEVNGQVAELNALSEALNQVAAAHNLEVVQMQGTQAELGPEFGKGLYEEEGRRRTVTIYQASGPDDLVRVLAHELGHALGLDHVADPGAVMHARMQGDRPELGPADLEALRILRSRRR